MQTTMIRAAVAVLLGAALTTVSATEKIAVIDVARVIREYDAARNAEERLEERANEFSVENETMLERHDTLKREFERLRDESLDAALTDAARAGRRRAAEEKLQEVAEYEQEIRETTSLRRRQLEQQRQRVFRSLIETIRAAVARQAEQGGYTMVLDASDVPGSVGAVLYHQSGHDLTAAVIERLNASAAAAARTDVEETP